MKKVHPDAPSLVDFWNDYFPEEEQNELSCFGTSGMTGDGRQCEDRECKYINYCEPLPIGSAVYILMESVEYRNRCGYSCIGRWDLKSCITCHWQESCFTEMVKKNA